MESSRSIQNNRLILLHNIARSVISLLSIIVILIIWQYRRSIAVIAIAAYSIWLYMDYRSSVARALQHHNDDAERAFDKRLHNDAILSTGQQLVTMLCPKSSMLLPHNECLQRFLPVWQHTECLFSRTALLWGSPAWNDKLTLEENVDKMLPWLVLWTNTIRQRTGELERWAATQPNPITARYKYRRDPPLVDGFVIEIRGAEYGHTIEALTNTFHRVMKYLNDHDPYYLAHNDARRSLDHPNVGGSGWYFEFNHEPVFVTSFASCYGTDSSRYMWPTADNMDSCFILFQGEYGFRFYNMDSDGEQLYPDMDLTDDELKRLKEMKKASSTVNNNNNNSNDVSDNTKLDSSNVRNRFDAKKLKVKTIDEIRHTDFERPKTMRDKIRCKYWANGRQYHWHDSARFPSSLHMVRPLHLGDPWIEWWRSPSLTPTPSSQTLSSSADTPTVSTASSTRSQ